MHIEADELGDVAAELGAVLRRRARRVALIFSVDEFLRNARVHRPRLQPARRDCAGRLAVEALKCVPEHAMPAVGRAPAITIASEPNVAIEARMAFKTSVSGLARTLIAPKSQLIEQRDADGATAHGAIGARDDFHRHRPLEVDGVGGLTLDQAGQQWRRENVRRCSAAGSWPAPDRPRSGARRRARPAIGICANP